VFLGALLSPALYHALTLTLCSENCLLLDVDKSKLAKNGMKGANVAGALSLLGKAIDPLKCPELRILSNKKNIQIL